MSGKFGHVRGFILPVPRKNLTEYRKMAKIVARIWREHGALQYVEAVSDDVDKGKLTSFPRSVKLKKGEVVIFSWATFPTKAAGERAKKGALADKRLEKFMNPETFPFDGSRMYWGGFQTLINK